MAETEQYLRARVADGSIDAGSAALFGDWLLACIEERGIAENTAYGRARYLVMFARALGCPVPGASTGGVRRALAEMRRRHSAATAGAMRRTVLAFLTWAALPGIDLAAVRKVKAPKPDRSTKSAAGMLTEEEVRDLITACRSSRDRALISILYEGGFRPVELIRLEWQAVKFDAYGAVINVDDKTGRPRYVRLIAAAQALAAWQADYPGRPAGSARVFVHLRKPYREIGRRVIRSAIEGAAQRAGIEKRVYPYLFRHSRITHMIEAEIPESVVKLQHWGSLHTDMLATYAHVTGAHTDEVLLSRAGIADAPRRKRDALKPHVCPGCKTICGPTVSYCPTCGRALTEEAIESLDEALEVLRNHPEFSLLLDVLSKRVGKKQPL